MEHTLSGDTPTTLSGKNLSKTLQNFLPPYFCLIQKENKGPFLRSVTAFGWTKIGAQILTDQLKI